LKSHVIAVRREQDGAHVTGSPVVLAEASHFDFSMQGQLADTLTDAADSPELEERLNLPGTRCEPDLAAAFSPARSDSE
jgi:hypothetical protein